ncbi:MAG: S24 family peptidase [Rikenellaceae bacterium]
MTDWQRLEQVIKWAGKNTNSFAKELGLNRTENLYQIKKGNNKISKSLATKIVSVFPSINKSWLIFGEGNMLLSKNNIVPSNTQASGVPFFEDNNYNILSISASERPEATYSIFVPIAGECDLAIRLNSNALEPKITLGSIVLLKEINSSDIMYGYKYVILINGECILRIIKRDEDDSNDSIILQSINPDSEIRINRSDIEKLYLIKSSITLY